MKILIPIAAFFATYFSIQTPIFQYMFAKHIGTIFDAYGLLLLISTLVAFLAYKLSPEAKNGEKSFEAENNKNYLQSEALNRSLDDDGYKIYLVKKYPVEFNDVIKKHIFNNKLYETVEDVLVVMHELEMREVIEYQINQQKIEEEKSRMKKLNLSRKDIIDYLTR